jgi:hypothetical protein
MTPFLPTTGQSDLPVRTLSKFSVHNVSNSRAVAVVDLTTSRKVFIRGELVPSDSKGSSSKSGASLSIENPTPSLRLEC